MLRDCILVITIYIIHICELSKSSVRINKVQTALQKLNIQLCEIILRPKEMYFEKIAVMNLHKGMRNYNLYILLILLRDK